MRRGRRREKLFIRENPRKTVTVYTEFEGKKRVVLNPFKDITLASKRYKYDNFIVYTFLQVHVYKTYDPFVSYWLEPAFYVFYFTINKDNEHKMYLSVIDEKEVAIRLLRNLDINTHLAPVELCKIKFAFPEYFEIVKEKFPDAKIPV